MSATYSVFGLSLRSNAPIPGLNSLPVFVGTPDIEVHLGRSPGSIIVNPATTESPVYVSTYTDSAGAPALRIWRTRPGDYFHLAYSDGTEFWMNPRGTELWALWPDRFSVEDTTTYLLGPVLGLLLRFRGVTCLHASAIAFEDASVAFVGAEGAGKSTTAAAFAMAGYAVLSDDVVALAERDGDFWVSPAYPHVCLWPDSVNLLYGSPDALPPLSTNWEKRRLALGIDGLRFEQAALPLRAIYILDDRRTSPGPYTEAAPAQTGFLSLVSNSFATNMLDGEMRAQEFKALSRLVLSVPIRRLFTSRGDLLPDDLCRIVRQDFADIDVRK